MRLGNRDLASPGRDQIGMVAGIRSEWVAGIVGIRRRSETVRGPAAPSRGIKGTLVRWPKRLMHTKTIALRIASIAVCHLSKMRWAR